MGLRVAIADVGSSHHGRCVVRVAHQVGVRQRLGVVKEVVRGCRVVVMSQTAVVDGSCGGGGCSRRLSTSSIHDQS